MRTVVFHVVDAFVAVVVVLAIAMFYLAVNGG